MSGQSTPQSSRKPAAILLAASSLTVMAGAIVAPALPSLSAAYADVEHIELLSRLVLTMPALAIAVTGPVAGLLTDHWGRRTTLIVGLLLYGIGGSTGLYLESIFALLAGRAALGVAVAMVMTAATTLITDLYRGPERGRFLGYQAAAMALGGMVFLLSGGAVADWSWRAPFAVYLVAWLLVPAAALWLPSQAAEAQDRPLRTRGAEPQGATFLRLAPLYALGFVGMVLFYAIPVQAPFLLTERLGASGLAIGAAMGAMTAGGAVASMSFETLRRRVGHWGALTATFVPVTLGFMLLGQAHSWLAVIAALAISGLGFGLLMPNLSMWVATLAPAPLRGRALGALTASLFAGQFLSPLAMQPIAAQPGWGLGEAFTLSALVALGLGLAGALMMVRTRSKAVAAALALGEAPPSTSQP